MSGEKPGTEVLVSYVHGGAGMPEGFRQGLTDAAERVGGLLRERGLSVRIVDAAEPGAAPAEALAGGVDLLVDRFRGVDGLGHVDLPSGTRGNLRTARRRLASGDRSPGLP